MAKNLFPIIFIPLDGGPCAAKTSVMNFIRSLCLHWGIRLIIIPEAARSYFTALGSHESSLVIQQGLYDLQELHETFYYKKAKQYQKAGERVLVLGDRSRMTGKGYATAQVWQALLESRGVTEPEIARRYTNPIHLVTAADSAEEYYVNDDQRPETPEQAREIDQRLQTIWNGLADHVTIIKNHPGGNLQRKMEDTWKAVLGIMGLPVPTEDELWFSVDDSFDPKKIPVPYTRVYIEQDYLSVGDVEERVRMKQLDNGERWYFFTEKRPTKIISKRLERERDLKESQYIRLLNRKSSDHQTVRKYRYCFVHNYQYFELDEILAPDPEFKFKLEYSRTLENQQIVLPDFIPIIADVTGNLKYKTSEIARKLPALS